MLTTTLPASKGDGTPEFVLTLSSALNRDFEVTILAPRVRGAPKSQVIDGVDIRRFAYFPSKWEGLADGAILPNLRAQRWRLIEAPFLVLAFMVNGIVTARRGRPDVVNAHWMIPAGLVALMIRRLLGIPYLLTVHGADTHALNGRLSRWLKRKVLDAAHVVTPVSKEIAGLLRLPPTEIDRLVVPMGVDTTDIVSAVGSREPVAGRFLFVGRLAEKKGVGVLLLALSKIPNARAVVVGGGPDETSLRKQARELDITHRVDFLGSQPRRRVMDEMRLAQAVVIPSVVAADGDREGTPVVMAEAMAAGVPVVASDLAGLGEHIVSRENGLLVESGSAEALAFALRQVMDGKHDLQRWVENARRHLESSLDLEVMTQRYSDFLRSIVSPPESSS